jgi:hypothetical protein
MAPWQHSPLRHRIPIVPNSALSAYSRPRDVVTGEPQENHLDKDSEDTGSIYDSVNSDVTSFGEDGCQLSVKPIIYSGKGCPPLFPARICGTGPHVTKHTDAGV